MMSRRKENVVFPVMTQYIVTVSVNMEAVVDEVVTPEDLSVSLSQCLFMGWSEHPFDAE